MTSSAVRQYRQKFTIYLTVNYDFLIFDCFQHEVYYTVYFNKKYSLFTLYPERTAHIAD